MAHKDSQGNWQSCCERIARWKMLEDEYHELHGPLPEPYTHAREQIIHELEPLIAMNSDSASEQANQRILPLLHAQIHAMQEPRAALCLSGGGIRSATFALGVMQQLARAKLLDRFDYLSTVSGGGYIGSWFTAWAHRHPDGVRGVIHALGGPPTSPTTVRPAEVEHLREYSNYLSPRLGLLSADTWAMVAGYIRNLLINALLILPLLAAILMAPRMYVAVIYRLQMNEPIFGLQRPALVTWLLTAGLAWHLFGACFANYCRPNVVELASTKPRPGRRAVLWLFLLPMIVGAVLLTLAWWGLQSIGDDKHAASEVVDHWWLWPLRKFGIDQHWYSNSIGVVQVLVAVGAWLFALPVHVGRFQRRGWHGGGHALLELLLSIAIAFLAGALLFAASGIELLKHTRPYVVFAASAYLGAAMLAGALFRGLSSLWSGEADREWSARAAGWLLIGIVVWAFAAEVVLFAPSYLLMAGPILRGWIISVGGIAGVATAALGLSGRTAATQEEATKLGSPANPTQPNGLAIGALISRYGLTIAATAFVVALLTGIALATDRIVLSARLESAPSPPATAAAPPATRLAYNSDDLDAAITLRDTFVAWMLEQARILEGLTDPDRNRRQPLTPGMIHDWRNEQDFFLAATQPVTRSARRPPPTTQPLPPKLLWGQPVWTWLNTQDEKLGKLHRLATTERAFANEGRRGRAIAASKMPINSSASAAADDKAGADQIGSPVAPPTRPPNTPVRRASRSMANTSASAVIPTSGGDEVSSGDGSSSAEDGLLDMRVDIQKALAERLDGTSGTARTALEWRPGINELIDRDIIGTPRLHDADDWHELALKLATFAQLGCWGGLFVLLPFAVGCLVDFNSFSLHGLYRNRLVRCYLGASQPGRTLRPSYNRFSGFDPGDDLCLAELRTRRDQCISIARPLLEPWATLLSYNADPVMREFLDRRMLRSCTALREGSWRSPAFRDALCTEFETMVLDPALRSEHALKRFLNGWPIPQTSSVAACERYNVELLRRAFPAAVSKPRQRLFHVFNITLNVVAGKRLAWQHRKGMSFTASSLHCGSWRLGYRSSDRYSGGRQSDLPDSGRSLSLGTAMAISGAAANPNCGYHSSPTITFLMTLLNVRLGAWLGNPGVAGGSGKSGSVYRGAPRAPAALLLAEAMGLTDEQHAFVNLSDGGHFENLALYEMVLRRCRLIVVCDAGQDSLFTFEDLGNAVRKVSADLAVPITFDGRLELRPRGKESEPGEARPPCYCALGSIDYAAIDNPDGNRTVPRGTLIYIKPAFYGSEPIDVYNYAEQSKEFPHESTVDQFFSEPQFESYRRLGEHIAEQLFPADAETAHLEPTARLIIGARTHLGLPTITGVTLSPDPANLRSWRGVITGSGFVGETRRGKLELRVSVAGQVQGILRSQFITHGKVEFDFKAPSGALPQSFTVTLLNPPSDTVAAQSRSDYFEWSNGSVANTGALGPIV